MNKQKAPPMKHIWRATACAVASATIFATFVWSCSKYGQFDHSGAQCDGRRDMPDGEARNERDLTRGFYGEKDLYGMGTRIGIYAQWLASLIATIFLDFEQRHLTAAFMCFEIATLGAFFFLIFNHGCVFTIDCLVIVYFLFGGIAAVLGPDLVAGITGRRIARRLAAQDFIVMVLVCVVSTVTAWFWIRSDLVGDDVDFAPTPGGTSLFIIIHARDEQLQVVSIFMATFCVLLAFCTFDKVISLALTKMLELPDEPPPLMLASLVVLLAIMLDWLGVSTANKLWPEVVVNWACLRLPWRPSWSNPAWSRKLQHKIEKVCPQWKTAPNRCRKERGVAEWTEQQRAETHAYGVTVKMLSIGVCLLAFALAVTAIELTLSWNHVWGIYTILTAGQIVPLTGGILVLATVLWETGNGPLRYGGNYRRRSRLSRGGSVRYDKLGESCPLGSNADSDNIWSRIRSAVMRPSRHFRECGNGLWNRRETTVLQNVVMTWRMLAAENKNRRRQEISPLTQKEHRSSGETLTETVERVQNLEMASFASQAQPQDLSPGDTVRQRNDDRPGAATNERALYSTDLGTVSLDSLRQQSNTRTPTFRTAEEFHRTSTTLQHSVEMSVLPQSRLVGTKA